MPSNTKKKLQQLKVGTANIGKKAFGPGGQNRTQARVTDVPTPPSLTTTGTPAAPTSKGNFTIQSGTVNKDVAPGGRPPAQGGRPPTGQPVDFNAKESLVAKLAGRKGNGKVGDYNATHVKGKPSDALAKLRAAKSGKVKASGASEIKENLPKPGVSFGASAGPNSITVPGTTATQTPGTPRPNPKFSGDADQFGGPGEPSLFGKPGRGPIRRRKRRKVAFGGPKDGRPVV